MLRAAVAIVAGVLCAAGVLGWLTGHPGGTPAAIWGAIVLAAVVFERWRYRPAPSSSLPAGGWIRTDERFVDPESGATLQVWYEPRTGARRYVDIAHAADASPPARAP